MARQAAKPSAEAMFAAAMSREGKAFGPMQSPLPGAAPLAPISSPIVPERLRDGDVDLGTIDTGGVLGLDLAKLINGRLLVQGASGAGKSWTLRRLLEQTAGAIQQIVIDPEGEFSSYAATYGLLTLDGSRLDAPALAAAGRRARELRLSILLDLSDLEREQQMIAVTSFVSALIEAPQEHWHPCLVAVDEAHIFAPHGGQAREATQVRKAAVAALTDLMSRGRKRGLAGVLATQRIARMAKSVISEAHNFLIGLNTLDLDIRRAAETIGWDTRRGFDRLPMLEPGNFVAVGPAFSRSPAVALIGPVSTHQGGATPKLSAPEMMDPAKAAMLLDIDALMEASAADARLTETESLVPGLRAVRMFIRDDAFIAAARIWTELRQLFPEGARIADMHKSLPITREGVAAGLALLDSLSALEFMGEGKERAVRIDRGMLI